MLRMKPSKTNLIRDYLERQYLLEDDELNKITEINTELNLSR